MMVSIWSSLATYSALVAAEPALRAKAAALEIMYAPTSVLVDWLGSGRTADIAIITHSAAERLESEGRVRRITPLVRSRIGLAVRNGAPAPTLNNVADLREFLMSAGTIACSTSGASRSTFMSLLERIGIRDAVEGRLLGSRSPFAATELLDGHCDAAVQQVSELRAIPGIGPVSNVPPVLDSGTVFSLVEFAVDPPESTAVELASILTSKLANKLYRISGLEPLSHTMTIG